MFSVFYSPIQYTQDPYLHDEKIAVGLLVQLVLEVAPQASAEEVLVISEEVALPITLANIRAERSTPRAT